MARVVLAMSGGVDSSVAAYLLLRAGHEVIGVFMRHGEKAVETCALPGEHSPLLPILHGSATAKQGCCSAQDAADARRVADRLGIPFYALNLEAEFRQIIDYFVEEYLSARTPNPCVVCNQELKFGKLFDYANSLGAEYVATGHYARLVRDDRGDVALLRGRDFRKDQSYVLFGVDRELLDRMLLPVGDYEKSRVRAIAAQLGLVVADKPDSQEICFVANGDHSRFVRQRSRADSSGKLVTVDGRVVGRHDGIERFTIGQRRGIGVSLGEPYYVVRIDAETRQVVLGRKSDLARTELTASRCNWLVWPPQEPFACRVQIRYRAKPVAAVVEPLPANRIRVRFDEPCYGVAPGQAVVCYEGDRVLGGGWIDNP